jgi:type III secretion system FlhB-like substrate exporter
MQEIETKKGLSAGGENTRLAALSKAELEAVVIQAIREHRLLMESDQLVFDEWERAKLDCTIPFDQVESLEAECLVRRKKALAQQDCLSDLLDLLGYTPKIPADLQD